MASPAFSGSDLSTVFTAVQYNNIVLCQQLHFVVSRDVMVSMATSDQTMSEESDVRFMQLYIFYYILDNTYLGHCLICCLRYRQ